jgi:5-methylcytosine-specific restriction protein A
MARPSQSLERKFTLALRQTSREAAKEGYTANEFEAMLDQYGGVKTAVKLTSSGDFQTGFRKLCEIGREDLTTEAVMLLPEFRSLFTDVQLEVAQWRLNAVKD